MTPEDKKLVQEFIATSLFDSLGASMGDDTSVRARMRAKVGGAFQEFIREEKDRGEDFSDEEKRAAVIEVVGAVSALTASLLAFASASFTDKPSQRAELFDSLQKDQRQRVNKALLQVRKIEKDGPKIAELMRAVKGDQHVN